MDTAKIQELRNAFLQNVAEKGQDAVHPKDLERVKKDDHWLHRFLLHNEHNHEASLAMLWESVNWRKEFKANEINELVKMDLIKQGGFFPHPYDKDNCTLFVFKCKKHVKGTTNMDDLKRCVIYWFERLERQDKGQPITLFFDMEGCGLSNMDLELIKYLIGLFKQFYPFFLNYILIYEMPWILNAGFKIVKQLLPEKAVQKIKFVGKKDIKEFVPADRVLTCWGGPNDYSFVFIPEVEENGVGAQAAAVAQNPLPSNRKVHFADGSSMSESPEGSGDRDHDGSALSVHPSGIINFVKEGGELVSSLDLQNTDNVNTISFKLKTTSPEKFRVRPSVGSLVPGAKTTVQVTLLPGFQLGGLSRDKFLLMSTIIDQNEMKQDLALLWKDTSGRKVMQHRLKCAQSGEVTKNGNAVGILSTNESDQNQNNQLVANLAKLTECQSELHATVKRMQSYQFATLLLVVLLGILISYIVYVMRDGNGAGSLSGCYCSKIDKP